MGLHNPIDTVREALSDLSAEVERADELRIERERLLVEAVIHGTRLAIAQHMDDNPGTNSAYVRSGVIDIMKFIRMP